MATQTYCTQSDVEAILSEAGVLATIDDNEDGEATEDTAEENFVSKAIERAAERLNFHLARRYTLSQIATHEWCKWANAVLAAKALAGRRNNPIPPTLADDATEVMEQAKEIGESPLASLPGQAESRDWLPSVTNQRIDRSAYLENPLKVDTVLSTGSQDTQRKRSRI